MIKVLVASNINLAHLNSNNVEFFSLNSLDNADSYYDVVIFDSNSNHKINSDFTSQHPNIYKIVVIDDTTEATETQIKADAWILSSKIHNILKLIESAEDRLRIAKELFEANKILRQINADNDISNKSCDLILLNLKKATAQIKTIFEDQVEEMKNIHSDIKKIRNHLQDEFMPPSCNDVIGAAKQTDDLLNRTDDVIKAMFGFIRILQCEDRISQMIDGVKNLINLEEGLIKEHGIDMSPEDIIKLANSLDGLFTIQEQRDIAKGDSNLEKMISCGDVQESEPEEIELF